MCHRPSTKNTSYAIWDEHLKLIIHASSYNNALCTSGAHEIIPYLTNTLLLDSSLPLPRPILFWCLAHAILVIYHSQDYTLTGLMTPRAHERRATTIYYLLLSISHGISSNIQLNWVFRHVKFFTCNEEMYHSYFAHLIKPHDTSAYESLTIRQYMWPCRHAHGPTNQYIARLLWLMKSRGKNLPISSQLHVTDHATITISTIGLVVCCSTK